MRALKRLLIFMSRLVRALNCHVPEDGGSAATGHGKPRRVWTGDGVPETTTTESIGLLPLTTYGYVLVIAEPRGTGASFGVRQVVNSRTEAKDGAELVEWLAAQPFCDGKVATVGLSYHGQTQLGVAEESNRDACLEITHLDLGFNCRVTLYTCYSNKVHIIKSKLCKLRNHGLDKDSGFLRINATCKIIQGNLKDVLANFLRVFSVIC